MFQDFLFEGLLTLSRLNSQRPICITILRLLTRFSPILFQYLQPRVHVLTHDELRLEEDVFIHDTENAVPVFEGEALGLFFGKYASNQEQVLLQHVI